MFILSAIVFILIFSLIVLIHEWGHYKSALRHGVKVEEFGMGLPPKAKVLWKNKKGTEFTLNWIPFGGFVRMFGEDSHDEKDRKKKGSFGAVPLRGRIEIVLAGVFMNFILAWLVLAALFTIGTKPLIISQTDFEKEVANGNVILEEYEGIKILGFTETSLAKKAGAQTGDLILKINGEKVETAKEAISKQIPNETLVYTIKRGEETLDFSVAFDESGKIGAAITDKPTVKEIKEIKLNFFHALYFSFTECFRLSVSTVEMFGSLLLKVFTTGSTPDGVAGPIGIAQMTSSFVEAGDLDGLFKFMALISLSLAVINVMPIPALDGGRFVFLLIEGIIRRPVPSSWEAYINFGGYIFLMGLIILISIKDLIRIFSNG